MDKEVEFGESQKNRRLSKAIMPDVERSLIKWRRFNPSTELCGVALIGTYLEKRLPPRIGVPEVAFLGRSNVGKSSLLNKLSSSALMTGGEFGRDVARVGKTPGATASVNLYALLARTKEKGIAKPLLGFTDLPGFGYAKLSKETKASVQKAAERYLGKRKELALGILLVDARRVPSEDDRIVLAALYDLHVPLVVVATKVDKLNKNQLVHQKRIIRENLGLPEGQPLCVSSITGEGTQKLWKIIMDGCVDCIEELKNSIDRAQEDLDKKEHLEYLEEDGPPVEIDQDGNLVVPDDDGMPLSYEQGYDWIQGDVFYEREEDDETPVPSFDNEDEEPKTKKKNQEDRFDFKLLKKKARRMERLGEV